MLLYKQIKTYYSYENKKIIYFINMLLITAKLESFILPDGYKLKKQVKKKV